MPTTLGQPPRHISSKNSSHMLLDSAGCRCQFPGWPYRKPRTTGCAAQYLLPSEELVRECALALERCCDAQGVEPDAAHIPHHLCPGADQVKAPRILLWDDTRLHKPACVHASQDVQAQSRTLRQCLSLPKSRQAPRGYSSTTPTSRLHQKLADAPVMRKSSACIHSIVQAPCTLLQDHAGCCDRPMSVAYRWAGRSQILHTRLLS